MKDVVWLFALWENNMTTYSHATLSVLHDARIWDIFHTKVPIEKLVLEHVE